MKEFKIIEYAVLKEPDEFSDDPLEEHLQIINAAEEATKAESEYIESKLGKHYKEQSEYSDFKFQCPKCTAQVLTLTQRYLSLNGTSDVLTLVCDKCAATVLLYREQTNLKT